MSHEQQWQAVAWQGQDHHRVLLFQGTRQEVLEWLAGLLEQREPVLLSLLVFRPLISPQQQEVPWK